MPDKTKAPFRIAIRSEGDFVNAYYASTETMDGAMLMASVRRSILTRSPGTFDVWRALLQDALTAACVDALGVAPEPFEVQPAPEHERSGRA